MFLKKFMQRLGLGSVSKITQASCYGFMVTRKLLASAIRVSGVNRHVYQSNSG